MKKKTKARKKKTCLAVTCSRTPKVGLWCKGCTTKREKGLITEAGEPSSLARSLDAERQIRLKKRQARKQIKETEETKRKISRVADGLRVIQNTSPYLEAFSCPNLQIQVSQANCIHRIFVAPRPKRECRKCTVHNKIMDRWLLDLTEAKNSSGTILGGELGSTAEGVSVRHAGG